MSGFLKYNFFCKISIFKQLENYWLDKKLLLLDLCQLNGFAVELITRITIGDGWCHKLMY